VESTVKRKRILVADDDPVTLRFVTSLLESKGFEVVRAEDGDQALVQARAVRPDLIVTDLLMPYRDGFELVRALRDDPEMYRVPVIVISMRDREEDIVQGLEEGADDYMTKPFNARELVARVCKLLERADGRH
jgi:DNA-binding response OmpR family regulator